MSESTGAGVRVAVDPSRRLTTLTLDDQPRNNRLTVASMRALIDGLTEAHHNGSLLVLLRAEGPDFTLGRDQSEKPQGLTRRESLGLILKANKLLTRFPGISLCSIQGRALGFGSGLAVQSDITLASDDATLGFDEVRHGLAPLVVAEYLSNYLGPKRAGELIFTGRFVPAQEALDLGLVNRIVPRAELAAETEALVEHLGSLEPGALRLMKGFRLDLADGALADPPVEAVERLDNWLAAGRPENP